MDTPIGVVSLEIVKSNASRVAEYCREHGLSWRPHVKTHKSRRVARIQLDAGAAGLTVATPREAEVMATVCSDLLLAHPPLGEGKISRAVAVARHATLRVALDSPDALRPLAHAAAAAGAEIGILVEVDVGMRRMGVGSPAESVALARIAQGIPGVRFDGLLFYPGHIRTPVDEQSEAISEVDSALAVHVEALEAAGLGPRIVSGGSTPTLPNSHHIRGLTEIRPGTCIFNDRDMVQLGVCDWSDCAYAVRATVISTAVPGQFVTDAGSKALSKEPIRSGGTGYGVLRGDPGTVVERLSEEHGIVRPGRAGPLPAVGMTVDVIPNHVCLSVNLQDAIQIEDGSESQRLRLEGRGRGPWTDA